MPLNPPLYDAHGKVVPHDHPGILADDWVIRRISQQWVITDVKIPGGKRLSTQAFESSSAEQGGGLSLDLEAQIQEAGTDVVTHVTTPRWIASVRLTVATLREMEYLVGFSPIMAAPGIEANPHHGEAWGSDTKGKRKKLLKASQWLVPIDGCQISPD